MRGSVSGVGRLLPWGEPTLAPMSRLLARSLLTWDSAMSAHSSASSSSCCTLRNLDRLVLACSSCGGSGGWEGEVRSQDL